MIDDARIDDAIASIHAAAAGARSWVDAMEELAGALDAWQVELQTIDPDSGRLLSRHGGGPCGPDAARDYLKTFHRIDPRVPRVRALATDGWYHDHEASDPRSLELHPFYRDHLIPAGGRHTSACKLVDDPERIVLFLVVRADGAPPFSATEIDTLVRVRTHLRRALALQARIAHDSCIRVFGALLELFSRPMLLVGGDRRILVANAAARRDLASAEHVFERAGRLHCRQPDSDASLGTALHGLAHGAEVPGAASCATRRFVAARSPGTRAAVGLHLAAMRADATAGAFGADTIALVFFHDPRTGPMLDPRIVAGTFDFTPGEARVALGIARGLSPREIAAEHHVSIHTVRAQLRSAMAKVGIARQQELVRLLSTMPWIAS